MIANVVGEINDGRFTPGASSKPAFKSTIRLINMEELALLFGKQETEFGFTNFGTSNVYEGYKINVPINEFFNAHFAILGNSGAGKSCTVASILQKLYTSSPTPPVNSALFFLMPMVSIRMHLTLYIRKIHYLIIKHILRILLIRIVKY